MSKLEDILVNYPEVKGVHPACEAVPQMSSDELEELTEDIRNNGLANPVVLTNDHLLLDGRHRLIACYDALQEVRFDFTGVDPWLYVCSLNIKRRHLTVGQKAMFAVSMLEHEQELAKERQKEAGKMHGRGHEKVVATLPQPIDKPKPAPKSREKVSAAVGVGQKAIDKAKKITEYAPKEVVEQARAGKIDLEPAYREARKVEQQRKSQPVDQPSLSISPSKEMVRIITLDGSYKEIQKPQRTQFNHTNDSVDWASWTWNPITGCLHGCSFCYAREIALSERMNSLYPFGFEPAFHEYRLEAPKNTKIPDSSDPRDKRVFVCSMADLFGKWVPWDWIQSVFDACLDSPEWEYLFLTKWPNKYAEMPLLENAWYGASVIQQSDVARIEKAMKSFDAPGCVKWVSMEPMLEPIAFDDLSWCDLMVIGSQTSTTQPGGPQPEIPAKFDDVVNVVNQCREYGVPYYLKANLGLQRPGMSLPKMSPRRSNHA